MSRSEARTIRFVRARVRAIRRSLRGRVSHRLVAWFLLFSLVPLVLSNAVGYRRAEAIIGRLNESYLATLVDVQAQHVRDRMDRNVLLLQSIVSGNDFLAARALVASGPHTREMAGRSCHTCHIASARGRAVQMGTVATRAAVEEYLHQKLRDLPAIDALTLTTMDGHVAAFAARTADGAPDTLAGPLREGVLTSTPARKRPPTISVVVKVQGSHPAPVAVLRGRLRPLGSAEVLEMPSHVAGTIETYLLDHAGRPIFVSHPHSAVDYTMPLETPLLGKGLRASAGYVNRNGEDVVGSVSAVPGYPWRFVAELPAAVALGELWALRRLSLALEAVLVVLVVVAAWLVARGMVAPLGRLVNATRRLGQGEQGVRVTVREEDEIGELSRAFNEMTTALEGSTARVRELHQREMERAGQLATVGELASGVAHEIRNPVVSVAGGLDLVRRRIGGDSVLTPIMDEMARQLLRIQNTLQELLAFARPATPALAPTSLERVVDRAVRLVEPRARQGIVALRVMHEREATHLDADEDMLHQAVVNVLINAVEATPPGGHVDIETRRVGDALLIEVADSGRGIAPGDLEHVFKPFFTTRHTGTGLGLSITREIVQRHGGSVTLESTEGAGTTARITLPLECAHDGAARALQEQPA